jgi:cytoskeletal protein CcmA (bactofilin family)
MARGNDSTVIGRGTHIKARVTGEGDLEVQGHVDGEISVTGDVTVASGGLVGASINGKRIIVHGAVKGDLVAEEAVHLEDGAKVVGDIRASRIVMAPGALIKGYVQIGAAAGERRGSSARREAPKPVRREAPKPAGRGKVLALAGGRPAARRAPPPVVPVLKKGAKGSLKKRA